MDSALCAIGGGDAWVPFWFIVLPIALRDFGVCFFWQSSFEVPERMPALTFHTREDADKKED